MFGSILMRFYSAMLYAYPRQFRLEYGGEMQRLFRDCWRDVGRAGNWRAVLRFGARSATDWLTTAPVERIREVWAAGRKQKVQGFAAEWAVTILMYLFVTTTLVQAYVVPTGSMEGNLRIGDHMLVDRVAYARPSLNTASPGDIGRHVMPYRDVARGDIVAFLYPEDVRQTYVKRVIGVAGDHIRMADKQVIRNGRRLIEPYTQHIDPGTFPYRDNFPTEPGPFTKPRGVDMFEHHVKDGEVIVPPGALFVMGDNRENSEDSRFWGFVPREYVVGKPLVVYWSYDAPTEDLEAWSLRHVFDVALHFFSKTRWDRTLLVPKAQRAEEVAAP
jgi:signal peptidase I